MRYESRPASHAHITHLRRRAQRAEDEAGRLKVELYHHRARMADERLALDRYLQGPKHRHDMLLGAQEHVAEGVREMAKHHQTCRSCGGFSREALDDLLAPALARMCAELDLPEPPPLDERAGAWPVRPGYGYFGANILRPYHRQPDPEDRDASWRPRLWSADERLSGW